MALVGPTTSGDQSVVKQMVDRAMSEKMQSAQPAAAAPDSDAAAGAKALGGPMPGKASGGCGCSGGGPTDPSTADELAPPPKGAAAAPKPPEAPKADKIATPSADASKWLTGDTKGLHEKLTNKLAQLGERVGSKVKIDSGFRSHDEQIKLYALYKAGKGNLAAKPGTSNHESGNAADVSINGKSLRDDPQAKKIALELGLTFPVPSESWHVEVAK